MTKYSKKTVDEAVQLLDVYASQACTHRVHLVLAQVQAAIGSSDAALDLAFYAWLAAPMSDEDGWQRLRDAAAEAAQRLREGWRP